MTRYAEALAAANALAEQVQSYVADGRFLPRYFDRLFGLRTALGDALDHFAATLITVPGDAPVFAAVLDRSVEARREGERLMPSDVAVERYAAAVSRATAALRAGPPEDVAAAASTPFLRGALRLDRSRDEPTRQALAPSEATPVEPYYTSLAKLFPVEAVALYPLATGIAGDDRSVRLILIAVIGVFVVALRWFGTQDSGGEPDASAIAVALASFLLYAASLGGFGYLPGGAEQTRQSLAFVTIIWVALAPLWLRRARR
ncbi:hypothetical protein K7957_17945 [Sphingomonas yunnanensis]|uniref:hypothetical protein n=1 Tax=Sphingomonas yunnanensis TaxID=310400 RepID=UPI001CA707F3|nr:hypothetical protein [Sphingomonas yunnanensis]MBY9064824.1 hypothetical protein [Sphingomonas yunnanensis]